MNYLDTFQGGNFYISIDPDSKNIDATLDEAKKLMSFGIKITILVSNSMKGKVQEYLKGTGIEIIDDSVSHLVKRFSSEIYEATVKKIWVRGNSTKHGNLHMNSKSVSFLSRDGVEEWSRYGNDRLGFIRDIVVNMTFGLLSEKGHENLRFHTIGTERGDLFDEIITTEGIGTMVQRDGTIYGDGYSGADIIYKGGEKVIIDDTDLFAPLLSK